MNDSIPCSEVLEKLPLFVGGDLEPDAQVSVAAHLADCEPCASRSASASRARSAFAEALRAPDRSETPEAWGLWPGIRERLIDEQLIRVDSPKESPAGQDPAIRGRSHEEGPLSPSSATSAPTPAGRLLRFPRRVAALASMAAAVLLIVWADPFGPAPTTPNIVAPDGPTGPAIFEPVASDLAVDPGDPDTRGRLQRVGAEELELLQGAEPVPYHIHLKGPQRDTTVPAGYR